MLKTGGGYSTSPGVLASYVSGAVSSVFEQNTPRRVESMLSDDVADTVNNFTQHMLLSDSELGAVCFQHSELPGLYMDPVLQQDPAKYAEFLAQMHKGHLVRFDVVALSNVCLYVVTTKSPNTAKLGSG